MPLSFVFSVLFNKTSAPELVCGNASHRKGRVLKTAQPVLRDHQNRQLHRRGQIADKNNLSELAPANRLFPPR
jgi:hypothetical protein